MKKICLVFIAIIFSIAHLYAQTTPWKFAHVSDTHIGGETSAEDLRRTVKDINANTELQFVIITGDITEFGSDEELRNAKTILDSLNKPWFIVPGNHDANWSESGGNTFKKVFSAETFAMENHGYKFIGTNCGPNMRMSPGQVPRENIVWLDSVLKATPKSTPIIFVNHYPIDSALNNWYEVIDRLKTRNIQLVLCGHGHNNHLLNFEGIPGVMGRSNLRAKDAVGGYNIVTMTGDSLYYNERTPGIATKPIWTKLKIGKLSLTEQYKRPDLSVNQKFGQVKVRWTVQDDSDIGAGAAIAGDLVIVTNTSGWVKAYQKNTGKLKWSAWAGGKIYSTPAVAGNTALVACTDNYLYAINNSTGKIVWKKQTDKPMVASPVVNGDKVFCGGSDGHFKCYDINTGNIVWDYADVKGFVQTKPLLYQGMVLFGSWGNQFYAIDQLTGKPIWVWSNGSANRMFSPAACEPVAADNRVFIVAPDRYMTCLDATSGQVIWRKQDPKLRVRESMGMSADSTLIYAKTMDGDVVGFDARADSMKVIWKGARNMGYEISPTTVKERGGMVFATSNSGMIYAFSREDGGFVWAHKISNALVNPLCFTGDKELIASTMDGKIVCLRW